MYKSYYFTAILCGLVMQIRNKYALPIIEYNTTFSK